MKKTVFFMIGALLVGMGIAQANEGDRRDRSDQLSCRFLADPKKENGGQCTAFAKVCHHRREPAALNERCHDRLIVECNGQSVYNDGATHSDMGQFQFITGMGGNPALKYVSEHHGRDRSDRGDDSFVTSAWLNISGKIYEGFCAVQDKEDRDLL
jgi:hypothetical protein